MASRVSDSPKRRIKQRDDTESPARRRGPDSAKSMAFTPDVSARIVRATTSARSMRILS